MGQIERREGLSEFVPDGVGAPVLIHRDEGADPAGPGRQDLLRDHRVGQLAEHLEGARDA
jgi:hypothetical protein